MPSKKRHETKYVGVYYINGTSPATGKPDRIYYVRYRRDDKAIDEKAGRSSINAMTAAKAATIRSNRMQGKEAPNRVRRDKKTCTIESLWSQYKAAKPRLKGLTTDQNRFDTHIKKPFGKKTPSDIRPTDIDRLKRKLSNKAPNTVKNVLELLRRICNFATKRGICAGLSFTLEMPTVNNLKTEDLSPDQLDALNKALNDSDDIQIANMMRLALYSGLRRGEMFRLQWQDVNFEKDFIRLRDPKGGQDQNIPLNDLSRPLLEGHPRTKGSPFVFPGRAGKQRKECKRAANRIKRAAGLPEDFRALHGLRHVYASMLAASGSVDMYHLQKLMTHKSPGMTQRYAHLRNEALQKASNQIGQYFKS